MKKKERERERDSCWIDSFAAVLGSIVVGIVTSLKDIFLATNLEYNKSIETVNINLKKLEQSDGIKLA